jgi:glycosyltransferase involved in cell wall biosynthesis
MKKKNIILADCEMEEIQEFGQGIEQKVGQPFEIKNKKLIHHGTWNNIKRYMSYFIYPIGFAIHHKRYEYVIGWQQFFAIIYAGVCRLLHVKKDNIVVALNFTYKEKKGLRGLIYKRFMYYCVHNDYLDYIHVPSWNYAEICEQSFNIRKNKIIVAPFGLPDTYNKWKNSSVEYENYSFAIGRSNRDFDWLVNVWGGIENELLVIASDTYKPTVALPHNVIHRTDISGDLQFPYIANCKAVIIPIDNGAICSGDTVLLKAMSFYKTVIATSPSTLGEMYIEDEVNGILVEKDATNINKTRNKIMSYLGDDDKLSNIGNKARKSYELYYSRKSMGENIGNEI